MEKKRPPPFFLWHTHTHTHTYTHIPQAQRSKGAAASIKQRECVRVCARLKKRVSGGVREVADSFFLGWKSKWGWGEEGKQGSYSAAEGLLSFGEFLRKLFKLNFEALWGPLLSHCLRDCAHLRMFTQLTILSCFPVTSFSVLTKPHRTLFSLRLEKKKTKKSLQTKAVLIFFCCCCAISGCWSVKAGWDWPQVTGYQNRPWGREMDG